MSNLCTVITSIMRLMAVWTESLNSSSDEPPADNMPFMALVYQLHHLNFLLWNNEDEARRSDIDDATQVNVKRESHRLNQARNDAIEKVDEWLLDNAYGHLTELELPMRTETPGSVFDRLSILSFKVYHMAEQAHRLDVSDAHREACQQKLAILRTQQADLEKALLEMFDDLDKGKIKMKIYRQFKMYNDPTLNPKLCGDGKFAEKLKGA
jgi:hypothetical protein